MTRLLTGISRPDCTREPVCFSRMGRQQAPLPRLLAGFSEKLPIFRFRKRMCVFAPVVLGFVLMAFSPRAATGKNVIFRADLSKENSHLSGVMMKILDPPDFKKVPVGKLKNSSRVILDVVSVKRNQIIDQDAWFAEHSLVQPDNNLAVDDPNLKSFRGLKLNNVITDGERRLLLYGPDNSSSCLLLSQRLDNGKLEYALDFSNYSYVPKYASADRDFVFQQIRWATRIGDVLYVSHGHNTYAKSSFGMNAYVSAIDLVSMKALWHSSPLVSNAYNFQVYGDYLITGYGFTAELDFLFLLRRDTGEAVARIPVKSGPEYIFRKNDRLFVRTYDADYVFRILQKR